MTDMELEILNRETQRPRRVLKSFRMSVDILARIKEIAEQYNLGETQVVEMYLGAALGVRQFPQPFAQPVDAKEKSVAA